MTSFSRESRTIKSNYLTKKRQSLAILLAAFLKAQTQRLDRRDQTNGKDPGDEKGHGGMNHLATIQIIFWGQSFQKIGGK